MALMVVRCAGCGGRVKKERSEVNRSRRLGRRLFCTQSCGAVTSNRVRRSVAFTMPCPVCGVVFETTTHGKAKRHCSRSCASLGSVTPERRESQRTSGRKNARYLIGNDETLKRREAWKYTKLRRALRDRQHEFEYRLGRYVFDLALFDVKVLVEFDGPYHSSVKQRVVDAKKERVASRHGFTVARRVVKPAAVIPRATIAGL